jgi:hypothetical protein
MGTMDPNMGYNLLGPKPRSFCPFYRAAAPHGFVGFTSAAVHGAASDNASRRRACNEAMRRSPQPSAAQARRSRPSPRGAPKINLL